MALTHFLLILAISIEVILAGDVIRDPRSIGNPLNNGTSKEITNDESYNKQLTGSKSVQLLVGGHLKHYNATTTTEKLETLRMESAGGGKEKQNKEDDDEEKKTLAQQVIEGKYGLIQKELFTKPSKRPGIISYVTNSEVPKDTNNNLGGLDPEEIWLAEDHLLVLKGGKFPEHNSKDGANVNWPPIDDYKAPRRQVKIPLNPKVPPPFPVQLNENGPIEFIGPNGSTRAIPENFNPSYPSEGYVPGSGPFFPNGINNPGDAQFPIPPFAGNSSQGNGKISPPFPVPINGLRSRQTPLNIPPEFLASLPPGAAYLPPPNNQTDLYDEDDPSIYYPPPYSFFYPKENSTHSVPPGPLVPGIILPPPPDFFAPLEEKKNKTTTTERSKQIYPTSTPTSPPTSQRVRPIYIPDDVPEKIEINIPSTIEYENDIESVTPTPATKKPDTVTGAAPKSVHQYSTEPVVPKYTVVDNARKKNKYTKPTATTPLNYYDYQDSYYENNAVTQSPKSSYGPPSDKLSRFRYNDALRTLVSTTAIPLRAYFTTNDDVETNSVTALPKQGLRYRQGGGIITTRASPKINPKPPPASYYYYEEPAVTTKGPSYQEYFNGKPSQQQSYYNDQPQHQISPQFVFINPKQQYFNTRPRDQYNLFAQMIRPEVINSQIARLKEEIQSYLTTPKSTYPIYRNQNSRVPTPFQKASTPKSVYEYSFQAANYEQQRDFKNSPLQGDNGDHFRPIVGYNVPFKQQIKPTYQTTPSPIYVYNKHETNTVKPSSTSYQSTENSEYDYDDTDTPPQRYQQVTPQTVPKTNRRPLIAQYLNVHTTPNPINHAYYTPQDERLFDDRTKQYFNVFGQKINGGKIESVTQPLKNQVEVTSAIPIIKKEKIVNGAPNGQVDVSSKRPISLAGDTLVNYKNPRPTINPDSEFIPIVNPQYRQNHLDNPQTISLESDIAVNYKNPRPAINPNAEFINPNAESLESYDENVDNIETFNPKQSFKPNPNAESFELYDVVQRPRAQPNGRYLNHYPQNYQQNYENIRQANNNAGEGRPGSFISYQLPGNGAHFYFLTPRVAQRQAQPLAGYYYTKPEAPRLRRSRIRQPARHS